MSYESKKNGGCQAKEASSEVLDRRISLLVAAGSAMATGCEPCMDQIIPNLIETGVGDEEIRRAVEIGQRVKEAAADHMKEVADVLAGTHLAATNGRRPVTGETSPESGGCCG